ncbi:MAG: penicillin-binding protein 1C, partial [Bacteroidales bacterium]
LRLEITYSKDKILCKYVSYAPYGGNIVGLEAASWRYLQRPPHTLTWAEAAFLAVLPNAPSHTNPGKNRNILETKRNSLLKKLLDHNIISQQDYSLAIHEPIPQNPQSLPDIAPHLLDICVKQSPGKKTYTYIKSEIQENVNRLLMDYYPHLLSNTISNACAIVIDVDSGTVVAYVGNVPQNKYPVENKWVDMLQAERSTGSILKPFLYAAMIEEGSILPAMLIPDIPTRIGGFCPKNYDNSYDGAVPAKNALARSLNIPAVRMLYDFGVPKFKNFLVKLGMNTLRFEPEHYGLTLVLGGAEGKMYEIAGMYSTLARVLKNHSLGTQKYKRTSITSPRLFKNDKKSSFKKVEDIISPASVWLTFEALIEVNRPYEETGWLHLSSGRKVAWKTGTSYGFRDAWAVGVTPKYVVGVWTGNATGEGSPNLTGITTAAPLMFRIFNSLPASAWFQKPTDMLIPIKTCTESGHKASNLCPHSTICYSHPNGVRNNPCPYHKLIYTESSGKYRVFVNCYDKTVHPVIMFLLPPAMETYFRKKNMSYKSIPPLYPACVRYDNITMMEIIYPTDLLRIFAPRLMDGKKTEIVFELAHRLPSTKVFWQIDNEFVAETVESHKLVCNPSPGKHTITITDMYGYMIQKEFFIME